MPNVMILMETLVDKKRSRIKEKLPEGYTWERQATTRKNRKGRTMGEMIIGTKKELMKKGTKIKVDREGIGGNGEKSEER